MASIHELMLTKRINVDCSLPGYICAFPYISKPTLLERLSGIDYTGSFKGMGTPFPLALQKECAYPWYRAPRVLFMHVSAVIKAQLSA